MNKTLSIYKRVAAMPFGRAIFSRLLCLRAPYFKSIRPRFVELRPGYGEIFMRERRAVRNHLGSVHAIAMCNMVELVGGMTLEVSLPSALRWIPRGMSVEYLKMARTDLSASCVIPDLNFDGKKELPVKVSVRDVGNNEVMRATINMHLSAKK